MFTRGRVLGDIDAIETLQQMRIMHKLQSASSKRLLRDIETGAIRDKVQSEQQLLNLLIAVLEGQVAFDDEIESGLASILPPTEHMQYTQTQQETSAA